MEPSGRVGRPSLILGREYPITWSQGIGAEEERTLGIDVGPDYKKSRNLHNHYLQDRNAQKT